MAELIWLALLGPVVAALASWRGPNRAASALGLLAAGAGVLGGMLGSREVSFTWLVRNGSPLVEVGFRGDLAGGIVLLLLLAGVARESWPGGARPAVLLAVSAATASVFATDLVAAFLGLSLVCALSADSPRAQWAHRLSAAVAVLGLGALHHHAAEFGWNVPLLSDSPQSVLINGLLLGGLGAALGLAPWPQTRSLLPVAAGGVVLYRMTPLLDAAVPALQVFGGVAVLSLVLVGLRSTRAPSAPLTSGVPPLLALLGATGAPGLLMGGLAAWPVLSGGQSRWAVRITAAVLASVPLAALAGGGRWVPLLLLGAGLVLLGSGPLRRPTLRDGITTLLALAAIAAVALSGGVVPPKLPPVWALPASLGLLAVGRFSAPLPELSVEALWDRGWRGLHRVARWTARRTLPQVDVQRVGTLAGRLRLDRDGDRMFFAVVAVVVVLAYAAGVSR